MLRKIFLLVMMGGIFLSLYADDIGIDTIISPGAIQHGYTPMTVIARLRRYNGTGPTQNFPAVCSIVSSTGYMRYTNTQTVTWQEPLDTTRVTFASWTPTVIELCTVKVSIIYPDSNPLNNRKTKTTLIYYTSLVYEGFNDAQFPPPGWQAIVGSGTYNWQRLIYGMYPICLPYEGPGMAGYPSYSAPAGNWARLISPPCFAYSPYQCSIKFYMYHDNQFSGGAFGPDSIKVEISLDGMNFARVASFRRYEPITGWTEHRVGLGIMSGTYYIGFVGFSEYGHNLYIDYIQTIFPSVEEDNYYRSFTTENIRLKNNPVTDGLANIIFSLTLPSRVALKIFDASGRLVRDLVNEHKNSGIYNITWNCRDNYNREVAEGVYFYTLETANQKFTKKMVLIK